VPKPGTFEHHQDISFFAFNFEVAASANMRRSSLDLEENDVEEIEVAARHKVDLSAIHNLEDRRDISDSSLYFKEKTPEKQCQPQW
jgi:pyridoxine 5'-phosphate synthase PdxJ